MSFHINIAASSVTAAKSKLHDAYAPSIVKALIEAALDGIPKPRPRIMADEALAAGGKPQSGAQGTIRSDAEKASQLGAVFIGVFVEAYGHFDVDGGTSEMQRFIVRPLYE
jgi:hypothetical protein